MEALLRWKHPVHGLIPPAELIPLAEQSGLIVRLGDWVLAEACRVCRTWQRPGHAPVGVAVNVSPTQFDADPYSERVLDILSQTGIDASLVTLELTEGVLVRDPARARANLTRLRLAGVRIAIDDFGTGYSSLTYLTDLPADVIKPDHKFVESDSPGSVVVIDSVVRLAHGLGMQVVAEGIETLIQKDALLDLKCDQLQGYYFSHPVSAAALLVNGDAAMAVILAVPVIAGAKEAHLVLFGSAAVNDPDRAAAISRAEDSANQKAAGDCTGTITAIERTRIQCYGGAVGNPWTCVVSTQSDCKVELRKKTPKVLTTAACPGPKIAHTQYGEQYECHRNARENRRVGRIPGDREVSLR